MYKNNKSDLFHTQHTIKNTDFCINKHKQKYAVPQNELRVYLMGTSQGNCHT